MQEGSGNSKKEILCESTSNLQTRRDDHTNSTDSDDTEVSYSSSPQAQDHTLTNNSYHDHVYLSDVTRGNGNVSHRLLNMNRYPLTSTRVYSEDESDDSSDDESSTTQVGASIQILPRKHAYISDGYSSHASSSLNGDFSKTTVHHSFLWLLH